MALAMARESKLAANKIGIAQNGNGVVYATAEVHMVVPKAGCDPWLGRIICATSL